MLYRTLQQKVPLDTRVTIHLKGGSSVTGRLSELGLDHLSLSHNGTVSTIPLDTVEYWAVNAQEPPDPRPVAPNTADPATAEHPSKPAPAPPKAALESTSPPIDMRAKLQTLLITFQRRIIHSEMSISTPSFDIPTDVSIGNTTTMLWERARNMYEYAANENELDPKFGRVQKIVSTLESAYRISSNSAFVGRQLVYFLVESGDLQRALAIAEDIATRSSLLSDFYVLAAVASKVGRDSITLDALTRAFVGHRVSWDDAAWFVFVNLVSEKRSYASILNVIDAQNLHWNRRDRVNLLTSMIFILACAHRHEEATKVLQRMLNEQDLEGLVRETDRYIRALTEDNSHNAGWLSQPQVVPPASVNEADKRWSSAGTTQVSTPTNDASLINLSQRPSDTIAERDLERLRKQAGKLFFAGSTAQALASYWAAFEISESATDLGQILQCLIRLDQDKEALRLARMHLERFSGRDRLKILHPYGDVTRGFQLHDETIRIYEEVAKRAEAVGARVTAHVWTARAFYALGDIDGARAAITRALSDAPANRVARELLRRIEAGGPPLTDELPNDRPDLVTNETISAEQDFLWIDIDALTRGKAPAPLQHENRPSNRVAAAIYRQGESTNPADYETRARFFGQAAKEFKEYLRLDSNLRADDLRKWEIAPARYAAACAGRHYERMVAKVQTLLTKGIDSDSEGSLTRDLIGERDAARAYYLEAARADLNIRESRRLVPLMLMKYLQTGVVSALALRPDFEALGELASHLALVHAKPANRIDGQLPALLRSNWNTKELVPQILQERYVDPSFLVDHCIELWRLSPDVWKFFARLDDVKPLLPEMGSFMTEALLSMFSTDELPAYQHLNWEQLIGELAERRRAAFSDATGYLFEIESHGTTWTNLLDLRLQFAELAGSIFGVCDTDRHFVALLTDAYEQLCEVRPQGEARQGAKDLLTRLDALTTAFPTPIGLEVRRIVWKWKRNLLGESAGITQRDSARIGVALGAPWATVAHEKVHLCVRIQNSSISETAERASVAVVVNKSGEVGGELEVHSLEPNVAKYFHVEVDVPPHVKDTIDLEFIATWYSGGRTTPITNTYRASQVPLGPATSLVNSPWNPESSATKFFVGRDEILRPITAGLRNPEGGKNYFILGSTGTGKTNLLTRLKTRLLTLRRENSDLMFLPIYQDWRHDPPLNYAQSNDEFFQTICRDLSSKASQVSWQELGVTPPEIVVAQDEPPHQQFRQLVSAYRAAGFYIVFLWDEFSAFHGNQDSLVARGVLGADFLYMIRALAHQDVCRHVMTGHMHLKRLLEDRQLALSGEMRNLETHELTPLSTTEAEQLIRAAEPGLLFSSDAVQAIQSLSANWPKLIQTLCLDCCLLAIDWDLRGVGRHEVDEAVAILLRTQSPPLDGRSEGEYQRWDLNDLQGLIWDQPDLPPLHKRIIQTIAEADERGIDVKQLATRLTAKAVPAARIENQLEQALEDLMEPMGPLRHTTNGRYRINVGLFRQWCLENPVDAGVIVV
jgi:tetratricopeptide (TPR) repeat protein